MADDGNSIRVSNKEIYNTLLLVKGQVDLMAQQNVRGEEIHKDHENRLTKLEVSEERRKVTDEAVGRSRVARSDFWRWFVPALVGVSLLVVTIVQVVH